MHQQTIVITARPARVRVACVLAMALALLALSGVWTAASSADPAPRGARSCGGPITYRDSVSLQVFVRRVSCSYARRYVHWCFHSASLHGWRFRGQIGFTGRFRLTRGTATMWLDEAGGGAKCLNR